MKIVLGICGSISAYKSLSLIRDLKELRHLVKVVMSKNATRFITPLSASILSNNQVKQDIFPLDDQNYMDHIDLVKWADCILISPASANIIAKLANGFADCLLSCICMASKKPIFIVPAMNTDMLNNKINQLNILKLKSCNNYKILPTEKGLLACGDYGEGKLLENNKIIKAINDFFNKNNLPKVLINTGATRQYFDSMRFISNSSSAKMGIELANESVINNLDVYLVGANLNNQLDINLDINLTLVETNQQMQQKIEDYLSKYKFKFFIGCAAIADFEIENLNKNNKKFSKSELINKDIKFKASTDIIKLVANHNNRPKYIIGFAAFSNMDLESDELKKLALLKLKEKQIDLIIANVIDGKDSNLGDNDRAKVIIFDKNGNKYLLNLDNKQVLAKKIILYIERYFI